MYGSALWIMAIRTFETAQEQDGIVDRSDAIIDRLLKKMLRTKEMNIRRV